MLTLTKIKDVFAIFKNLVLEGGGGGSGGRGGTAAGSEDGAGSEETERLVRQVKELKSLLLQRDSEIQILVNMVQKGKTAEDVSGAQLRASRGSTGSTSGRMLQGQGPGDDESETGGVRGGGGGGADQQSVGPSRGGGGRSYAEQQRLLQEQRERENQERLIKRHLYGVPPPPDTAIFDDAAGNDLDHTQYHSCMVLLRANLGKLRRLSSTQRALSGSASAAA